MKHLFTWTLILYILSGCAMYIKSNVKDKPKRNEFDGELNLIDYKDVKDGYRNFIVSTPFIVFNQRFTATQTYIPAGLEFFSSSKRGGDIEAHAYYLVDGFQYSENVSQKATFNYKSPRLEYRFLYAYPVWRATEQIDRFQMDIGRIDNNRYYAVLPTHVDIELAIRGGVDRSMSSFVSGNLEEYITDIEPNFYAVNYYEGIIRYHTFNSIIKVGAIFQRKIATRFDTNIDGHDFHAASYLSEGFYADIAILATGSNTNVSVEYAYSEDGIGTNYYSTKVPISASQIFKKRPVGFAFGYKRYVCGRSVGMPFRWRFELGFQPGYFPTLSSSVYANFGMGIGLGKRN